jgi:Tol biopolymer transport system component
MGEVYRARDPRLSREVAIKVLPQDFASDPVRLKRFEKEARSASALNHPNIVTVHDIGTTEGVSWIAMEKVEGETLRKVLMGGALPLRKLLPIAAQIADGLAKAHEAGVVHRDLKPENVMVSREGRVKILDFGLAKLTRPVSGSDEGSKLPTETGTSPGMLVGTAGYMSPEQAAGDSLDYRSDQFAFGAILYEMATGRRAFQKKTGVDTLAAVLNEEPEPIEKGSPQTPAPLRWIAQRCLAKDPEQRYASTKDLARDIATLRDRLGETASPAVGPAARRRIWPGVAAAVAAAALAAATAAFVIARRAMNLPPPSFQQLTFRRGDIHSARFAPDGESIVYTAAWDGKPMEIFLGGVHSADARAFGLSGAELLSISRSGEMAVSLNRVQGERILARVSMGGGLAPREVLAGVEWADWAPDGQLAIVREQQVEYPPGKVLYKAEGPDPWITDLRFSPDGQWLALVNHPISGETAGAVVVLDVSGSKETLTEVFSEALGLAWSPEGDVWFTAVDAAEGAGSVSNQSLYSVTRSGKLRRRAAIAGTMTLRDIASDGRLLVTRDTGRAEIWTKAPGETQEREMTWLEWSNAGSITPDGKLITFTAASGSLRRRAGEKSDSGYHVYIRRTDGSPPVRLGPGQQPILSRDGKWVLVGLEYSNDPKIAVYPTGAGEPRPLPQIGLNWFGINHNAFLPDGQHFVFAAGVEDRPRAYIRNIDGSPPRPLTAEGYGGGIPSQDGKWIVMRGPLWGPGQKQYLYSVAGGTLTEIRGLEEGTRILQVSPDARSLFLAGPQEVPRRVDRFDIATGRRELWRAFMPADPAGVSNISVYPTPSGEAYMYAFNRRLSDLYLLEGVR